MKADVRRRWRKANDLAACRCNEGGRPVKSPADAWSAEWEYWNDWDAGQSVLASLTLDGIACEDLP